MSPVVMPHWAGVDIAAGEKAVEMIKDHVRSTFRPEGVGDIGGFGGLFSLDPHGLRDPLLVSSTDGVGTKSMIARLTGRYDTIVFHDMGETIGEKEQANLRDFVVAGGGIVSTHHAIVNYTSWPWWYQEVIGGKYFVDAVPGHAKSEYKEGVDFLATAVKGVANHPVLRGVPPLPVHDEVYRGMWQSPGIQVLMQTDHPLNDKAVVYIGPYAKARVVYIQLGHSASTMRYPGYRRLVRNAILWTARKD